MVSSSTAPILRVARPTDNLQALIPFYRDALGLDVLAQFEGHKGFDGIILGKPGWPYHLEFTTAYGHPVGKAPSQDHLLTLYIPDVGEWQLTIMRMHVHGYMPVKSFNPYWDALGVTFEDPDGYRVVLQQATWKGQA